MAGDLTWQCSTNYHPFLVSFLSIYFQLLFFSFSFSFSFIYMADMADIFSHIRPYRFRTNLE